jgi:hypothetical protein
MFAITLQPAAINKFCTHNSSLQNRNQSCTQGRRNILAELRPPDSKTETFSKYSLRFFSAAFYTVQNLPRAMSFTVTVKAELIASSTFRPKSN